MTLNLSFFTSTPNLYASGSPNCKRSSFLAEGIIQNIAIDIISKAGMINCHEEPPKLPIVQNVRPLSSESVLIYVNIPIPTDANAFTAIPTSNI